MIIFISGTGTDVGKSFVNMELNALLMERGFNIISIKPIETGIQGNLSLTHDTRIANDSKSESLLRCESQDLPKQSKQNLVAQSATESRPLRGAKNREQGCSSATADFLLEAEKRGSPPKSEKRELLARRGSGAGGAALLRKDSSESNGQSGESNTDSTLRHCDSNDSDSRDLDCFDFDKSKSRNDDLVADSQVLDSSLRTSASLRMTENGADSPCDAQLHAQNQSVPKKIDEICFYRFSLPAAPFVADLQGIIDIDFLKNKIKALEKECDILLVEGAGGLFVPIKKDYFFIDLINDLGRESHKSSESSTDSRESKHKSTLDSPESNPTSPKSKLLCLLISHDKLGCIDAILSHREALERRNIEFISIVNVFNESQFMQISYPFLRDLKRNFIFQHQKREILEFIVDFMKS